MSGPVLEFQGVWKSYDGSTFVLRGANLAVGEGEAVALFGDNGSGKTTLLNLAGCLDVPTKGAVRVAGRDVTGLSERERASLRLHRIGFVFQDHNLLADLTVAQNVLLPLRLARAPRREARAEEVLAVFGLSDLSGRRPGELSTGQRQLVAVARALANGPRLVLADEPTASLDEGNASLVFDALRRANREMGASLVIAHHEPIPAIAERRFALHDGMLVPG